MKMTTYNSGQYACLIPDGLKVKSHMPNLVACKRGMSRYVMIQLAPPPAVEEGIVRQIGAKTLPSDEIVSRDFLRQGEFFHNGWKGREAVIGVHIKPSNVNEYGWWLLVQKEGIKAFLKFGSKESSFEEDESSLLQIIDSIETGIS